MPEHRPEPAVRRGRPDAVGRAVAWGLLLASPVGCTDAERPTGPPLPRATVVCGHATASVEVAREPASRERGLMFRRELDPGTGMLFVYPRDVEGGFWMRNTFVPLSIAFMEADGRILHVADMAPFDETPVDPRAPFRMALEVPQGWFAEQGLYSGDRCEPRLPPTLSIW